MTNKNDGGPAFPESAHIISSDVVAAAEAYSQCNGGGMSLRDYFAAKAMQAILTKLADGIRPEDCKELAHDAYFIADAMLRERERKEPGNDQ